MNGKIVCIWGSPGSGKTVLSLAIAAKLVSQKKNVVIYSGDKLTPHLKVYLPETDISGKESIGSLLMSNRYEDAELAKRMLCHPNSEYLCFVGMAPGDNYITYQSFSRESTVHLANKLAALADYVIIDGTSNPIDDMMTLAMMELADIVIRTVTPDSKGVVFQEANKTIYRDAKFNYDKHITVMGNVKENSPYAETLAILGQFDYVLNYSYEVENKFIGGELMKGFNRSAGIKFEKSVTKLVERIEKFEY